MALRALRSAGAELVEALLLDAVQRAGIAGEKPIDRRVVAHERRLVGLNGDAEEEPEVVRHLTELARTGRITAFRDHAPVRVEDSRAAPVRGLERCANHRAIADDETET